MKKILSVILAAVMLFSCMTVLISAGDAGVPLTDEWKAMVEANYAEFIAEVDGDENKIPLVVSTDQHGMIGWKSDFYKYIDSVVDWGKISKIINLGDTVDNYYNFFELLSYRHATRMLPRAKRIEVVGNHDRRNLHLGFLADIFFPTPGAKHSADWNNFVVKDEKYNVRYLAFDFKVDPWSYENGVLNKTQAKFLIKELSKDDASDIVLLAHPYIFKDNILMRDGTVFTGSEWLIGDETTYADVRQSFLDMLTARKNKTAGVLIDCDGNEYPYDFSGLEGDLIMTLHGHHHTEGYETKGGVTEFLFQSMRYDNLKNDEPNCFYFAYIDKATNTFKCWKNIVGYDAWEIEIA